MRLWLLIPLWLLAATHLAAESPVTERAYTDPADLPNPSIEEPDPLNQTAYRSSVIGVEALSMLSSDDRLAGYWHQPTGLSLFWRFPFYAGEFELRGSYLPLRAGPAGQSDLPDINNIVTTLGWGVPIRLSSRNHLSASVRIGNNFMYRPEFGVLDRPESEFVAGGSLMIHHRFGERLGMRAGVQHDRVYTFHRIDFTMAVVGLEIHLTTPRWIVRFLK